jgi:hypothetical protein
MDFKTWFNAVSDEECRAGYHEGGHIEYARHIDPNVPFAVNVDGVGGGRTVLNLAGFTSANRYAVAVAGCLAEAKGMGGHGTINSTAPGHDVAQQIHDKFEQGGVGWQVDVMVRGNCEPSSCNGIDFEFLGGAPPDLAMLQAAVAQVTAFFNNDINWRRVRHRAWTLAKAKRPNV